MRSSLPFFVAAALSSASFLSSLVSAVPANPLPFTDKQPDGTEITLRIHGDERYAWETDENGYTVTRDERGWIMYADKVEGTIVSTGSPVGGSVDPKNDLGLEPHLVDEVAAQAGHDERQLMLRHEQESRDLSIYVGTKKDPYVLHNVMILMRFRDHVGRPLPPPSDYEYLMNTPNGHPQKAPTGSVYDVFYKNSYERFKMKTKVVGWITVSQTERYVSEDRAGIGGPMRRIWEAVREAMDKAHQQGAFREFAGKQIPAVSFAHSGYGAEFGGTDQYGSPGQYRFWAQQMWLSPQWTAPNGAWFNKYFISSGMHGTGGNELARIGVWAHEAAHFITLPDMYDSATNYQPGAGMGNNDMMANMWGLDGSQRYPPNLSGYSRLLMKWARPVYLDKAGEYEITASCYSDSVHVIRHGFDNPKEFLIVENRFSCDYDKGLRKEGGLSILHLDLTGLNGVSRSTPGYVDYESGKPIFKNGFPKMHYKVKVVQADGRDQLEWHDGRGNYKDLFRSYSDGKGTNYIGDDGIKGVTESGTSLRQAWPNTKQYAGGVLKSTGIKISDISYPGRTMKFTLSAPGMPSKNPQPPPPPPPPTGPPPTPPPPPQESARSGVTTKQIEDTTDTATVTTTAGCTDVTSRISTLMGRGKRARKKTYPGCSSMSKYRCGLKVSGGGKAFKKCPETCYKYSKYRRSIKAKCGDLSKS